jgi:hypothetical protein
MRTLLLREDLPRPYRDYHPKTLRKMAESGEIPVPVRIGRKLAWFEDTFQQFLQELDLASEKLAPAKSNNPNWSSDVARAAANKRWSRRASI